MNQKNVITWKDADLALFNVACWVLDEAARTLRHPASDPIGFYPTADGAIANGDLSNDPGQGWWSYHPEHVHNQGARATPLVDPADGWPSAVCWYSFQNLIRYRLAAARSQIKKARYKQTKNPKSDKQSSRNPEGRKKGSKYNRRTDSPEKSKP